MVDFYGRWIPENNYREYPKSKWCDCDYLANAIMKSGYIPETSLQNLVFNVFAYFSQTDDEESYEDNLDGWLAFIRDSGGFKEFDHHC